MPITSANIDGVIAMLGGPQKTGHHALDFSRTRFDLLDPPKVQEIFRRINHFPQPFSLKLNHCVFNEVDLKQIEALTLELATAPNLRALELQKSLQQKRSLIRVTRRVCRNPALTRIHLDGTKVTPPIVRKILRRHQTRATILLDGLLLTRKSIFAPAKQNSTTDAKSIPLSKKTKSNN